MRTRVSLHNSNIPSRFPGLLCCLVVALLLLASPESSLAQYVIDDAGQATPFQEFTRNDTETLSLMEMKVRELEAEIATLKRKVLASEVRAAECEVKWKACATIGPPASGCSMIRVSGFPESQKTANTVYARVGEVRGRPHFATPAGDKHLYFTSEASGAEGMDNWVISDALNTAYRAHVFSRARSPEYIHGTWMVFDIDHWAEQPGVAIVCVHSHSAEASALIVYDECADGHRFQGYCYRFFPEKLTWDHAEQECVDWGRQTAPPSALIEGATEEERSGFAHLASVHSDVENAFCQSIGDVREGSFWFGLTLIDGERYAWTDGTPVDYQFYEKKTPPPSGTEVAKPEAVDPNAASEWNHQPAEVKLPYVCKRPLRWSLDKKYIPPPPAPGSKQPPTTSGGGGGNTKGAGAGGPDSTPQFSPSPNKAENQKSGKKKYGLGEPSTHPTR